MIINIEDTIPAPKPDQSVRIAPATYSLVVEGACRDRQTIKTWITIAIERYADQQAAKGGL
jgi:hypothetical protein